MRLAVEFPAGVAVPLRRSAHDDWPVNWIEPSVDQFIVDPETVPDPDPLTVTLLHTARYVTDADEAPVGVTV